MRYFIYAAAAFVVIYTVVTIVGHIKDHRIYRSRKDDKIEDFVNHFVGQGVSGSLALSVYNHLQNWMSLKDFPVRPQDDLAKIYGIDDDLEDLIVEVAEANDRVVPPEPDPWPEPIGTVEDLILLIASFPRRDHSRPVILDH